MTSGQGRMKALKFFYTEKELRVVEVPKPCNPGPKCVIIKMAYGGLCGTDQVIIAGKYGAGSKYDVIMGHEISGTIVEAGGEVKSFSVGDKVVVDPNPSCGECRFCIRGQKNYCIPGSIRGTTGVAIDGGWAEYVQVPIDQVFKLPDQTSLQEGVLCEPLSCVMHGLENIGFIPDDAEIVVIGAGIIGLLWACLLHNRGFRDVTICEISEGRKKIAKDMGLGFKTVNPSDISDRFRNAGVLPENDGYDVVVDCTGSPKACEEAFTWLRRGGKLVVFGCCPKGSEIKISPAEFMLRECSIIGCQTTRFNFPRTTRLVANMTSTYLNFEKLGIKIYTMEQHQEALDDIRSGSISKAVFRLCD